MRLLARLRAYLYALTRARRNRTDLLRYLIRRPALLGAVGAYEAATMVSNRVGVRLKYLAYMKASSLAGCEFCLDLSSPLARSLGIEEETLADLPRYAQSDRFTPLEKAALDLTVAMTATPAEVSPELRQRLLAELTPGQLTELAAAIAWENHRSRLNNALGVRAMGFADGSFCLVPERPGAAAVPA
jgi:alkylhydroperoxidase family enzyme